MIPQKEINLALSGSGFKFPAHVGALFALVNAGLKPTDLAATSGGSIIAALYATGMYSVIQLRDLAMNNNWSAMLRPSSLLWPSLSYCNGTNLHKWLLKMTKGMTFADLENDLIIMASDIGHEAPFEFSKFSTPKTRIADAVRASTAIPFVYSPYIYEPMFEGIQLADGGLCNNISIDKLSSKNPRLGIQLVANDSTTVTPLNRAGHLLNLMMNASEAAHIDIAELSGAEVVFVETGYASGLDRNMANGIRSRLFNAGVDAVQPFIKTHSLDRRQP